MQIRTVAGYLGILAFLSMVPGLDAAVLTVVNTDRTGSGSLSAAVSAANSTEIEDTIVFDLPGPGPHIIAVSPQLDVLKPLVILNDRAGDEKVTLEAIRTSLISDVFRFYPDSHTLLAGLTIQKGYFSNITAKLANLTLRNCVVSDNENSGGFGAGGIGIEQGDLTLINCVFKRNKAHNGGAIRFAPANGLARRLIAINCVFEDNVATATSWISGGGAIYIVPGDNYPAQSVSLELTDCTFSRNTAAVAGGAIITHGANTSAKNCTFEGNRSIRGGAIYNDIGNNARGVMTYENCTFSNNFSENRYGDLGGAVLYNHLFSSSGNTLTRFTNCTFSGNANSIPSPYGVGDLIVSNGRCEVGNNIFQRGTYPGTHFAGSCTSLGNNLSDEPVGGGAGTAPGGYLNAPGDVRNTDPRLAPLANNGGPTRTHALLAVSRAIDAGNSGFAPATDQRGVARVNASDIGAYEFDGAPITGSAGAKADFDGDGDADFAWQNVATGERVIWFLRDGVYESGIYLPTIAPEWRIASAADLNGDTHADFVWQNINTGERVVWFLRNGQYQSGTYLPTVQREWEIASAADFNADGHADFVWQNTQTGERVIWFLRDGQYESGMYLQTVAPEWRVAGAADFNADGHADFAWQNINTGERVMWFLRNGQFQSGLYLETVPPEWRIAATADFNADGYGDFAWQNINTGERVMWFLRDGRFQSGIYLPTIDPRWDLADH